MKKDKHNTTCTNCEHKFTSTRLITKQGENKAYSKPWIEIKCPACNNTNTERIKVGKITTDYQLNKWAAQNPKYRNK